MKMHKKELASKLTDVLLETLKDQILNKKTIKSVKKHANKIAKKVLKAEQKTQKLKKKAEITFAKEQHILAKKQGKIVNPRIVKDEINIVNRSVENKTILTHQPVDHQA